MDAKETFSGHEQTLPVLSRPPAAWSAADPIPHTPYTLPPSTDAPTESSTSAPRPAPPPSQPAPSAKNTKRNASSKVRKPRKPANAAAGKGTLFWVNSDQQSASGGTKEETLKRIRSHVMSEHNRKKRMENNQQYKDKSWKHLAFQPPETIPGSVGPPRPPVTYAEDSNDHAQAIDPINVKQELVPASTVADYYSPVPAQSWEDHGFDGVVGYQTRPPPPPPIWAYLGSGAHDPFNTGHTQLTDRMMRHLQNCQCPRDPLMTHFSGS